MAEAAIGDFYHRFPEGRLLHRSSKEAGFAIVPSHSHSYGHIRVLFASDTPGPDGRLGWWEKAYSPIRDDEAAKRNDAKASELELLQYEMICARKKADNDLLVSMGLEPEVIGWKPERDGLVRANGPDSLVWIPEGWRHEFVLLSETGYHECIRSKVPHV